MEREYRAVVGTLEAEVRRLHNTVACGETVGMESEPTVRRLQKQLGKTESELEVARTKLAFQGAKMLARLAKDELLGGIERFKREKAEVRQANIKNVANAAEALRTQLAVERQLQHKLPQRYSELAEWRVINEAAAPRPLIVEANATTAATPAHEAFLQRLQSVLTESTHMRHACLSELAQAVLKTLQAKVRRGEEALYKYQSLFIESRGAMRCKNAIADSVATRLGEMFYEHNQLGIDHLQQVLNADVAPTLESTAVAREGHCVLGQQQALAKALQACELLEQASQARSAPQLKQARGGELQLPSRQQLASLVMQLCAQGRKKEMELCNIRAMMATLRDETEMIQQNVARLTGQRQVAARADASARERDVEARLADSFSRLQERLSGALTELRALKQREAERDALHAPATAVLKEMTSGWKAAAKHAVRTVVIKKQLSKAEEREHAPPKQLSRYRLGDGAADVPVGLAAIQVEESEKIGIRRTEIVADRMEQTASSPVQAVEARLANAMAGATACDVGQYCAADEAPQQLLWPLGTSAAAVAVTAAHLANVQLQRSEAAREVATAAAAAQLGVLCQIDRQQTLGAPGDEGAPDDEPQSLTFSAEAAAAIEVAVAVEAPALATPDDDLPANVFAIRQWNAEKALQKRMEVLRGQLFVKARTFNTNTVEQAFIVMRD